jgi:2-phosphoglycerate kinase
MRDDWYVRVVPARERMGRVRWVGGGSGAGKTTIARRIASTHHSALYSTDDVMAEHADRVTPTEAPRLQAFRNGSMDDRWVHGSPSEMLDSFHWYAGEGFELIVEDLAVAARDGSAVVAEGFRLLPHLVAPLLADPSDAVWLLPTPEFRRAAFEQRGTLWDIASRTSNPERALSNLLERDAMFTDRLRTDLDRLGLLAIEVNVGDSEDDALDRVLGALRPLAH